MLRSTEHSASPDKIICNHEEFFLRRGEVREWLKQAHLESGHTRKGYRGVLQISLPLRHTV